MDKNTSATKSLFERSYKSIRFIKGKDSQEPSESIADFYRNLPPEKNTPKPKQEVERKEKVKVKEEEKTAKIKISDNKHSLFKAIESHDIEYIKRYLSEGYDPFVEDEFKWNIIMMSVSSSANDILSYLLANISDKSRLLGLIEKRDQAGNSVTSLAKKFHNKQAIEIIEDFRLERSKEEQKPIEIVINETLDSKSSYQCQICKNVFNQSKEDHLKSIVHQLNDPERASEVATSVSGSNHLKSDNKGYQMLIKSGWNETSGLGMKEQGVRNPITGKVKLNRTGIGIKTKSTNLSQSLSVKNIRLKKNNDGDNKTSLKSFKKSQRKSKTFEMKLRRYFNS